MTRKSQTWGRCALGVLTALLVDYAVGLPYLAAVMALALETPMELDTALKIGLLPLPKDLVVGLATAYLGFRVVRVLKPVLRLD